MEPLDLPVAEKSIYIRFLLEQLVKKYHINLRGLAGDLGIVAPAIYRFMNQPQKTMSAANLELIEDTVIDLYGPILEGEVRLHKPFIDELKEKAYLKN